LYICPCAEEDIVIIVSNGVTDNFDAEYLGLSPREVSSSIKTNSLLPSFRLNDVAGDSHIDKETLNGNNYIPDTSIPDEIHTELPDTWDEMDPIAKSTLKRKYTINILTQLIQSHTTPSDTVKVILDYCSETTKERRKYMKRYPNRIPPRDYKTYPGILDHATCLCFEVKRGMRPVV